MRYAILVIALLLSLRFDAYSQKDVFVTKYPQTVPDGKKWVMARGKAVTVEVHPGTLKSGTPCSAMFGSYPGSISWIIEGEYGRPNQAYGILYNELAKVPQSNGLLFQLIPISFYDKNLNRDRLHYDESEEIGVDKVTFISGQKVYVSNCVTSIKIQEYNMSASEIAAFRKKKEAEESERQRQFDKVETERRLAREAEEHEEKIRNEKRIAENKNRNTAMLEMIASNSHFTLDKLDNGTSLKPILQDEALDLLYDYALRLREKESNSISPLMLWSYFNKEGRLVKIGREYSPSLSKAESDSYFSSENSKQMTELLKLSSGGVISLENVKHKVNSALVIYLNWQEDTSEQRIKVAINKKGEIRSLDKNVTEEQLAYLMLHPEVKTLSEGKHIIDLRSVKVEISASDTRYDKKGDRTIKKVLSRLEYAGSQKV
ncbi:hypothetical protein [Pontibacter virosus]|uniref:Uncharacterized protein n=1 Tax=Pontibacter virosus TaxID=1765052 RepID=A0A2U1AVW0_9BACT|nr:hypothetical protein [Pontibacter virosus]PVY40377.1 hypothetical protein C8E01_1076 [Pontibacter virosus]